MSAIRGLVSSAIRLFKRLMGASREEVIAKCDGLKRQLEYRGMSLLKQAERFHREAVFYARKKMLRAARARLEVWSEYKSEAESCIIMASLYDRIRLRVLRAASLRDVSRISELVVKEFEKLLGKLPDDPVSARYMLEGTIEALDGMMSHYVEAPLAPETEAEVEEELRAILEHRGEAPPAPEAPEAVPETLVEEKPLAGPVAEGAREEKPKTKEEEVEGELKRIKELVGM